MGNNFFGKTFIKKTFKETQELGFNFAKTLEGRVAVCLYGELGSGKTTFTQGFAKGLGIDNRIISPTFVIVRCYELQAQISNLKSQNLNSKLKNLERFYHVDLYRINNEKDVEGLGIEEILRDRKGIVIFEWAEKLGKYLSGKRVDIHFYYEKDSVRRIVFGSLNQ